MAVTATIALGASTLLVDQKTTATLTVSNSGGSAVTIVGIVPKAILTGSAANEFAPAALGVVPIGPGTNLTVPASGSLKLYFDAIFFEPSTGPWGYGSNTYSVTANIRSSDGSLVIPTAATVTVNPMPIPSLVSYSKSVLTASASTVASGAAVNLLLTVKNAQSIPFSSGGLYVTFAASGGTATGTISAVIDNGNGTYSATFTGVAAGTATTITASIQAKAISSTAPTVAVTAGAFSLSQSVVTRASATVASGSTDLVTLTAKDAAGNQLPSGGLTVAFSRTGGVSTGTFGSTTDVGNGTYTALFTGVLAGSATSIASTINTLAVTSTKPTIQVLPGSVSLSQSLVTVASPTVANGMTDLVTLTAKDAAGNQLAAGGLTVLFANTGGTSTGTFAATSDVGNGTYTSVFTATANGTATSIGSTVGGSPVTSVKPTITVTA